jgi:hypothetical protein
VELPTAKKRAAVAELKHLVSRSTILIGTEPGPERWQTTLRRRSGRRRRRA